MSQSASKASDIRRSILRMANRSKSPHVGSALSCVDILSTLYFGELRLDPWEERDLFILSKAHAAMALYAVLAARGVLTESALDGYGVDGGTLPAHLDRFSAAGVEVSAGSLGHGFGIGLGWAHGLKVRGSRRRVFALIGDGEAQEGAIWEGALFAAKLGLSNFTAIVDDNNQQGYGRSREICSWEPVKAKWEAFGWCAVEADGHDHRSLRDAFLLDPGGRPKIVLAKTVKGKGVSFMEDKMIWHYYVVTDDHLAAALRELP